MREQEHAGKGTEHARLVELSVVLVATSNNPSILNPDFLAQNGITNKDWRLQDNPVATPLFSQVVYEGGLTVRADPERVMFAQDVSEEPFISPMMAERYVRAVPHVPYRAVGINPKLCVDLDDASSASVTNVLDDRGAWLSFEDSKPEIQLKVIYSVSLRKITMDIGVTRHHSNSQQIRRFLFQANVHRDLKQTNSQTRIEALASIVHAWENDVHDCITLAGKFMPQALRDRT